MEGHGKSYIAPLFHSGAIIRRKVSSIHFADSTLNKKTRIKSKMMHTVFTLNIWMAITKQTIYLNEEFRMWHLISLHREPHIQKFQIHLSVAKWTCSNLTMKYSLELKSRNNIVDLDQMPQND